MKRLVIGILAHVDAGKTTLSEALLYTAGAIRRLGRVDHRDAHLDTHTLERARGITIFSKQALFETDALSVTLIDTPGHADFSAEAERALQILDYAILVISATDGVQAHTETLWQLLRRNHIPTFIFVTKGDLPNAGREALTEALRRRLGEGCVDIAAEGRDETIALLDDALLERYLEDGTLEDGDIAALIRQELLFPCCFGAALRLEGVEEFLDTLTRYTVAPPAPEAFGARVYKISRDTQGNRLTFLKVTGGSLAVRAPLTYTVPGEEEAFTEKATQLRLYSGASFTPAEKALPGQVCAVLGLSRTYPGMGLGTEGAAGQPVLEPVLTYRVLLPPDTDARTALPLLRQLEEEEPLLRVVWDGSEIRIQLMGQVQIEIIKSLLEERFHLEVELDSGRIVYKETIAAPVEGVGHFEPLRHYAEVHLLLEPLEQGSGLVFDTACSEDALDRNWQRLILTHLEEKVHRGVLTGSPITDMKITLMSGRAHLKHTEGGDFRQATYRAVRQGLMQAESVLLEPWYSFRLELPNEQLGHAISDLQMMGASFSSPELTEDTAILTGTAPISAMREYALDVAAYTRGRGRLACSFFGYGACRNAAQVIADRGYDPEADLPNTPDSVFCAHGGGFTVKWDQVPEYMHLDSCLRPERQEEPLKPIVPRVRTSNLDIDEKELMAIFEREFGPIRHRERQFAREQKAAPERVIAPPKPQYLIVDGYNMIFAWEELKALAKDSLDAARQRLMDALSNYRGFKQCELVLVFDAYRVKGGAGSSTDHHGIHVVYTKQDETGDMYIERLTQEIGRNYTVRVATSDALIQMSALRSGVLRMSAGELEREVAETEKRIREVIADLNRR